MDSIYRRSIKKIEIKLKRVDEILSDEFISRVIEEEGLQNHVSQVPKSFLEEKTAYIDVMVENH